MQKPTEDSRTLVTPAVAARMMGVCPQTLATWRRRGYVLAVATPTGQHRYPLSEIERIIGQATAAREPDACGN